MYLIFNFTQILISTIYLCVAISMQIKTKTMDIDQEMLISTDADDIQYLDNDKQLDGDGQEDFTLLYNEVRLSADLDDVAETSGIRDHDNDALTAYDVTSSAELDDVAQRAGMSGSTDASDSWAAFDATRSVDTGDVAYSGRFSVAEGDGEEWSAHYDPMQLSDRSRSSIRDKKWELNCHEAAIYLQEGRNNDKFTAHPKNQEALPAYLVTHNWWFYSLNLLGAILVLALALLEPPAVFSVNVGIHASLELFSLMMLVVELGMRMKWLGVCQFFRHRRTVVKSVSLVIMLAESITVLVRQRSHVRVTRAIRPLFLLDCYHMKGVRRFIRQVMQSLPAVIDMLIFILFFMLLFSMLGFFLFQDVPNDEYFINIQTSFVSLFILLTTANYPDVMQPAYADNKWSAIFFIVYLAVELYLFMNLLLAVVYDSFLHLEKVKLRNLLLHKRTACEKAFKLLVSKQNPNGVSVRQFEGLMKYYQPKMTRRDVYLTFKALHGSKTGTLTLDEFHAIYSYASLTWKSKTHPNFVWSSGFHQPLKRIFKGIHQLVTWKWFDYVTYAVIILNFVWILADTIDISVEKSNRNPHWIRGIHNYIWCSTVFVILYIVEALLKILGLGPGKYFTSGWNVFDFLVTCAAAVSVLLELTHQSYYFMLIFRPLRLLRLFKLKRRYRDVLGTIVIMSSILFCISVVIVLVYYFFAIIGMEIFAGYDMRNCCKGSMVEQYYTYNSTDPASQGYYYLSSFDNILVAGVTLFELTVVNNWYIIMEGYAARVSQWSRLYFMLFYLVTMVLMTVVVTFILEAFMFRMQYRSTVEGHDLDEDAIMKVDVALSPGELAMCMNRHAPLSATYITHQTETEMNLFGGERLRSKDDFSVIMYKQQVKQWIEEHNRKRADELQSMTSPTYSQSQSTVS